MAGSYTEDPFVPHRRHTREVRVGDVGIGGSNPIRIQSMTTTDTRDTQATADQTELLASVGCEIVRITAPSLTDAENLAAIRKELDRRKVRVPLVADIHFTPNAAMAAAKYVEKIRINPGNFADKKKFAVLEYTDAAYAEEIERVAEKFRPLVRRCKELGRAIRIGTNHGSLSDRIMNRFGDTPAGMVESALEFVDVCESEGFYDIVFSMKSSNTQVAVQAYRLLAARLAERSPGEPSYPFHVGVTEAGDGEDGRIKSAIGIGALLVDGIGDTIRVSLTEPPEEEVPVASAISSICSENWDVAAEVGDPGAHFTADPYAHSRRVTRSVGPPGLEIGSNHPVRVEIDLGAVSSDPKRTAEELVRSLKKFPDLACEGLTVHVSDPNSVRSLQTFSDAVADAGMSIPLAARISPDTIAQWPSSVARVVVRADRTCDDALLDAAAMRCAASRTPLEWNLHGEIAEVSEQLDRVLEASARAGLDEILVSVESDFPVHAARLVAARLEARGASDVPIALRHRRRTDDSDQTAVLRAAHVLGASLCDGIGDAISLEGFGEPARAVDIAYRILQGARLRTSRTEFISCPSCGRTLFDLVETTERIKARTGHLVGVKIAIMGCIVNGPGEMADADFGYVGSGPGKVNLYVSKDLVVRNVPDTMADDRLVDLIRERGRWVDPS
ncbi:MAG TPA: (E)-4-hydroxy-3-methylbut-2-enyl-diphosphate synthase [Myxococcota bacterium]